MTSTPERTALLIGRGTAVDRADDPSGALDAFGLMRPALQRAAEDAGPGGELLLERAGEVIVMEGTWQARDPVRLVMGERSPGARRVVVTPGVLQQSVLSRAAAAVRDGRCEVVVVLGGEAKWRESQAGRLGVTLPAVEEADDAAPHERVAPEVRIINSIEIERNLTVAANQYALIQTALGHRLGRSPAEEALAVGELVARMAAVAAGNPERWVAEPPGPEAILGAPLVAWPYTRPCCSQWNVDQAAALIFCSEEFAGRHGIDTSRAVYPVAAAESNHVVPLTERQDLGDWPTARAVAAALSRAWGRPVSEVDAVELYSCFPVAVDIQRRAFGLGDDRPVTVTGGMAFAGGPYNSSTIQAMARVVDLLRSGRAANALVTSVSGLLSKGGASVWSAARPAGPFVEVDVTAQVAAESPTQQVDGSLSGSVTVLAWTVAAAGRQPATAIVVAEDDRGVRTVACSSEPGVVAAMLDGTDWVGRHVRVDGPLLSAV